MPRGEDGTRVAVSVAGFCEWVRKMTERLQHAEEAVENARRERDEAIESAEEAWRLVRGRENNVVNNAGRKWAQSPRSRPSSPATSLGRLSVRTKKTHPRPLPTRMDAASDAEGEDASPMTTVAIVAVSVSVAFAALVAAVALQGCGALAVLTMGRRLRARRCARRAAPAPCSAPCGCIPTPRACSSSAAGRQFNTQRVRDAQIAALVLFIRP